MRLKEGDIVERLVEQGNGKRYVVQMVTPSNAYVGIPGEKEFSFCSLSPDPEPDGTYALGKVPDKEPLAFFRRVD